MELRVMIRRFGERSGVRVSVRAFARSGVCCSGWKSIGMGCGDEAESAGDSGSTGCGRSIRGMLSKGEPSSGTDAAFGSKSLILGVFIGYKPVGQDVVGNCACVFGLQK